MAAPARKITCPLVNLCLDLMLAHVTVTKQVIVGLSSGGGKNGNSGGGGMRESQKSLPGRSMWQKMFKWWDFPIVKLKFLFNEVKDFLSNCSKFARHEEVVNLLVEWCDLARLHGECICHVLWSKSQGQVWREFC